ncbi:MAG: tetratricopeptide repeat protein [Lysobacterales bacterium]
MSFISELKRRNVFRAGFAYAVVWWLLVQIAGLLLDAFSAPEWIFRFIIVLLAVGFPIALIVSWFFELTTEGLIKSADLAQHEEELLRFRRYLNPIIISMLSAAVILFSLDKMGWIGTPLQIETVAENNSVSGQYSLAVLPFTNRSNQAENAYFVDGIHDDLLTMLARFNSFSVTSRTSVLRYQDSKKSIPEISAELGVSHILEGAVQRDGDHIRVNAQLINAGRDDHLWAETFDRELSTANLFEIQSSIARAIAAALNTKLSNADEHRLDSIPTDSLEAYDAYLLGKQSLLGNSVNAYEAALVHFGNALALDDSFAGAYAGVCEAQLGMYGKSGDSTHFKAAESACEQALAIDSDRTEVHIALGTLFLRHGDFQRAEDEQRKALASEPKNIEAMVELGLTLAEQGKIREAETVLLEAESLQPDHWPVQDALFSFYRRNDDQPDRYERAVKHAMRVVELSPKSSAAWNNLGTAYHSLQQFDAAKSAWDSALKLQPTRTAYTNRGLGYYSEGRYAESAEMQLKAIELAPTDHRAWGRLAESYRAMGENEDAERDAYAAAIPLAESRLEINDQDWRTIAMLGTYYAHSDRQDDARSQIESALTISKRNPEALLYAALALNALGEEETTLTYLEEMVERDDSYRNFVIEEPDLQVLRGNERFERLIYP